jgi:hypothetical protein
MADVFSTRKVKELRQVEEMWKVWRYASNTRADKGKFVLARDPSLANGTTAAG